MWICSCHAVNDGMIKEFAKKHGCAWKKMTQELKVGTQCGACAKEAKRILEETAGKPPRKRRARKAAADNVSVTSCADASAETSPSTSSSDTAQAVVANPAVFDTGQSQPVEAGAKGETPPAPAPGPAFLPCGKCTCTCGK